MVSIDGACTQGMQAGIVLSVREIVLKMIGAYILSEETEETDSSSMISARATNMAHCDLQPRIAILVCQVTYIDVEN